MAEQTTTPQVEETANNNNVQPEKVDAEAPVANNKVVESTEEKPVDGQVEEAEVPAEESKVDSDNKVETADKVEENKEADKAEEKSVDASKEVAEEAAAVDGEQEPVSEVAEKTEVDSEVVDEKEPDEPVAEETNGVCKRKVSENGAEVVEDEKSPKKAKVVDDGDQAPVEETAA